jgi:hypothetical protein
MSSTDLAPQFQSWVGQVSNLDRCTRCGRPRSVHGPDWSCPAGTPQRPAFAAILAGSALAVGAIALRLSSAVVSHQLAAGLFLAGVILAMTGLAMLGPQR